MKHSIQRFDRAAAGLIARFPPSSRIGMEFFTLIGQPPFTVGIGAAVLGYGAALEKPQYIVAGSIAIATIIVTSLLKLFLRRARPVNDYVRHMLFQTFSFPSGHAAGGLVSYGLAAFVVSLRWPELTVIAWTLAIVFSLMIGISRVYLGAHYASDVVGGWIVGAVGLLALLLIETSA